MVDTLLDKISKYSSNTIISENWLTGQIGKIVDLKGDCIFRFVDYDTDGGLRLKHTTEEGQLSCPIVACGLVGYWLHRKDSEGTKAIFDGYYELRLKEYEKAHENDDDAWKRDLKKEFACSHHVPTEKKWIKASEALFPYITESDQKKIKNIMANYLEYANSKRVELYPEEEIPQNDNSDLEYLKTWQDNSDLDYYLSENHWNYHVNTLLYKNLLVFHEGKELGAFLDVSGDSFTQPIRDYTTLYGSLFNEAYRLCSIVITTPVPQTKVAWFANQAATWKFRNVKDEDGNTIEIAPNVTDLIESYHILGMVNAILTFSNVQKDTVNEFLIALSVYNDNGLYFCGNTHRFEQYNEVYEAYILANMVNGNHLRPDYDNKSRDEYLRHNIPWYEHLAAMLEEEKQKAKEGNSLSIAQQHNVNSNVFNNCQVTINNMPAAKSSSSKKPKAINQKNAGEKNLSDKPKTLKYYTHGNKGILRKQGERVKIIFEKWNKWGWIDSGTTTGDFDAFFEGEPRHCNITWKASTTVLTLLLQELLKQSYIEKQKMQSATSMVRDQFGLTPNFDESRLADDDDFRIKVTVYLLNINNPLPLIVGGSDDDYDITDAALQEVLSGQLRVTKGI